MIRREFLLGLSLILGLGAPAFGQTARRESRADLSSDVRIEKVAPRPLDEVLVEAADLAAVHYDPALSEQEILRRVEQDAESLGLELFRTLIIGKVAVFEGSPSQVRERLSVLEGFPAQHVSSVYFPRGTRHPKHIVALTSTVMVEFDPAVREAEKERFYTLNGFRRIAELSSGTVLLDSNRQPGLEMVEFCENLAATSPLVVSAQPDFLMDADSAARSNSIILEDTFYFSQWYLENFRENTSSLLGINDEDIDVPRAWMLNRQSGAPFTFGNPSVVVGVFDSGIQLAPTHTDLTATMDPRVGIDLVDGGQPGAPSTTLGAHGTAMSGLIAAARNDRGIVGVAPGVRLYTVRVLGEDFGENLSASSAAVVSGLQNSILAGLDVNVHPYVLNIPLTESPLDDNINQAFRQTMESGRGGLGTTNIAAAGNFYSQVGFPASSPFTFSVGGVTDAGDFVFEGNWGGAGVDFVMPTYRSGTGGSYISLGTGILTTDLTGNRGISRPNPFLIGNREGAYGAIGSVPFFNNRNPFADVDIPTAFRGTSVASALAAGLVALMYSDSRYDELSPLRIQGDPSSFRTSRDNFRARSSVRPNDVTILDKLRGFSDLPAAMTAPLRARGAATYADPFTMRSFNFPHGFNERLGFGRPSASRLLAVPAGNPGPEPAHPSVSMGEELYSVTFDALAPFGIMPYNEELWTPLARGWESDGNSLGAVLDDEFVEISPFLSPVQVIYFEDGTSMTAPFDPDTGPLYFYAWTDSLTTTPEQSDNTPAGDGGINLLYNPEGQYQRNTNVGLVSPQIPSSPTLFAGMPFILTLQIAHELGVENVSNFNSAPVGEQTVRSLEIDPIDVEVRYSVPLEEGFQNVTQIVGTITGDSAISPKRRLETATIIELDNPERRRSTWRGGPAGTEYNPLLPPNEMVVRTYRFVIPPLPAGVTQFRIGLVLRPGPSFLPVWTYVDSSGQLVAAQMLDVFRAHRGFLLYSARVNAFHEQWPGYLDRVNFELGDGFYPTWRREMNEVVVTQPTAIGGDFLVALETRPEYLENAIEPDFEGAQPRRPFMRFMETFDPVTGIAPHPDYDLFVMTASGPNGAGVYLLSPDGVNQRAIVDSEFAVGARTPSFARNGQQIAYASENYLRMLSFQPESGEWVLESILEDHPFLHDFHDPVFDPSGGFVFFTARRKGDEVPDSSLNLYLVTRSGRIISPRVDAEGFPLPLLAGWEGIDIYDLEMAPVDRFDLLPQTGRVRLMFAAEASVPPIVFEGTLIDPAVPSAGSRLFILENLDYLVLVNDDPIYREVLLQNPTGSFDQSARLGRFSPDGAEIAWVGFNDDVNLQSDVRLGRIVRQFVSPALFEFPVNQIDPIDPGDPSDPDPAPIVDGGRVIKQGELNFSTGPDGWNFNPGGFPQDPALAQHELINRIPRVVQPGMVGMLAASENVISPPAGEDQLVATLEFQAIRSGTATFSLSATPPRKTVAKDDNLEELPTVLGAGAVKQIHERQGPARVYHQIISPPGGQVTPGQLVRVRILVDPAGLPVYGVEAYIEFDNSLLGFNTGTVAPVFTRNVGRGALRLASNSTNSIFGYWESPSPLIQTRPNSLYLMRALVSATPGTASHEVPTARMRVNSRNLESVYTAEANSFGDLSVSPISTEIRPIDLLFQPPKEMFRLSPFDRDYMVSFDLLNFLPEKDPNGGLLLHGMEFYRMDNAGKHYAIWGFDVPAGGVSAEFNVFGASGIDDFIAMSLRRCCHVAEEIRCVSGSGQIGISMDIPFLDPGFYTLVVVTTRDQEIVLNWATSNNVTGDSGDICLGNPLPANPQSAEACANRVVLTGNGRDPEDQGLLVPSVQRTFYDGEGFFTKLACDPTPNETVIKKFETVYEADFFDREAREQWVHGPTENPFISPQFSVTDRSLAMSVQNRDLTFGFWNADGSTISTAGFDTIDDDSPVLIYRGRYRIVLEGDPGLNPLSVPDVRLRLATNDFQRSVSGLAIAIRDGFTVPVPGQPKELDVYLVLEKKPASFESIVAAFDVLSFYPAAQFPGKNITATPLEMELVRIEKVSIPNYPLP